jgi:hypothetical protein
MGSGRKDEEMICALTAEEHLVRCGIEYASRPKRKGYCSKP